MKTIAEIKQRLSGRRPFSRRATDPNAQAWKAIDKMMETAFAEQRKARRWGIFFKVITLSYLGIFIFSLAQLAVFDKQVEATGVGHLAQIDVMGEISAEAPANADLIIEGLEAAVAHPDTRGIVFNINSGGGSPVQSDRVWRAVQELKEEHPDIPVYASISDIGASGAYYIATAADLIYADEAALVGSIGVITAGFGFDKLAARLGVERRVITSGENKSMLDPFTPLSEAEVGHWNTVLSDTHGVFIDRVTRSRGDRLVESDDLFSGLIWSGRQALELGLVDGHLSPREIAKAELDIDKVVNFTSSSDPLVRLSRQLSATGQVVQSLVTGFSLR